MNKKIEESARQTKYAILSPVNINFIKIDLICQHMPLKIHILNKP